MSGREDEALRTAGQDAFLRGLARLESGHPRQAVAEFETYADEAATFKPTVRRSAVARAAWWASRALVLLGMTDEAARALGLARSLGETFYGRLADGKAPGAARWPRPRFLYLDARTPGELVLAVIKIESGFDATAISPANALGLMQIIPGTASRVVEGEGWRLDRDRMLRDAQYNVAIGSTYLGEMIQRYHGYLPLALAAYNAGPRCIDRWLAALGDPRTTAEPMTWLESIPLDETRDYVQLVLAAYAGYSDREQG